MKDENPDDRMIDLNDFDAYAQLESSITELRVRAIEQGTPTRLEIASSAGWHGIEVVVSSSGRTSLVVPLGGLSPSRRHNVASALRARDWQADTVGEQMSRSFPVAESGMIALECLSALSVAGATTDTRPFRLTMP